MILQNKNNYKILWTQVISTKLGLIINLNSCFKPELLVISKSETQCQRDSPVEKALPLHTVD